MKLPPKRYLRKNIIDVCYYWGRVRQVLRGPTLEMNIWERFGKRRELFSNVSLRCKGVTHTSEFYCGTPVEIWTWTEIVRGKKRERLHIREFK